MNSSASINTPTLPNGDQRHTRMLVAYANDSTFVSTTREYLESFARFSRFTVRYAHVTAGAEIDFDLDHFDVVFQNYCARLPIPGYLSARFREQLKCFRGIKLLAVQDEYERTELLQESLREISYDIVFTCVPNHQVRQVYPFSMFPNTEFITVLTGYVPSTPEIRDSDPQPLASRPIWIGYRGRDIGGRYGRLAYEKYEIGRRMRDVCVSRGIPHDIEWSEDKRIYGPAWYRFLGSCRAVLGSESGSNIFDFDGSIAARYQAMSTALNGPVPYEQFRKYTDPIEVRFDIGQISPKVFEAASVRTPMILYSGRYSGLIKAGIHYIELKKDFSNCDDVLEQLRDLGHLQRIADTAYDHLVGSGKYSYAEFVRMVEAAAIRKAEERGVPMFRTGRAPLDPEPTPDLDNLGSMREKPTRLPRDIVHYYYKKLVQESAEPKQAQHFPRRGALISRLRRLSRD